MKAPDSKSKKSTLNIDSLRIELQRKRIKNVHIRVYPPNGTVRVTAPLSMSDAALRGYIENRLDWIRKQQRRIRTLPLPPEPVYTSGETHFVGGRAYTLRLREGCRSSGARLAAHAQLELWVPANSDVAGRRKVLENWYRARMYTQLPELVHKWENRIGVQALEYRVKRMRTLWGSCSIPARRIWLNLDLARRSPGCLEYVLVHEMVHLLERRHNATFYGYMDAFLPDWRRREAELTGEVH